MANALQRFIAGVTCKNTPSPEDVSVHITDTFCATLIGTRAQIASETGVPWPKNFEWPAHSCTWTNGEIQYFVSRIAGRAAMRFGFSPDDCWELLTSTEHLHY